MRFGIDARLARARQMNARIKNGFTPRREDGASSMTQRPHEKSAAERRKR
jgi:hypothetical protein